MAASTGSTRSPSTHGRSARSKRASRAVSTSSSSSWSLSSSQRHTTSRLPSRRSRLLSSLLVTSASSSSLASSASASALPYGSQPEPEQLMSFRFPAFLPSSAASQQPLSAPSTPPLPETGQPALLPLSPSSRAPPPDRRAPLPPPASYPASRLVAVTDDADRSPEDGDAELDSLSSSSSISLSRTLPSTPTFAASSSASLLSRLLPAAPVVGRGDGVDAAIDPREPLPVWHPALVWGSRGLQTAEQQRPASDEQITLDVKQDREDDGFGLGLEL